jgi:hypothetical protein
MNKSAMLWLLCPASVLALVGCERSTPAAKSAIEVRADAPHGQAPSEFVVFTEGRMTIEGLEIPVAVPTTVGSRASPETMTSDDPSVATIDASGRIVAHRAGTANVRAVGTSSILFVEVIPPQVQADRRR